MTQKQQILTHLQEVGPINPLQALMKYGCFRLGARIFELKEEGWPIKSKLVGEKRYAEYRLPPPTTT